MVVPPLQPIYHGLAIVAICRFGGNMKSCVNSDIWFIRHVVHTAYRSSGMSFAASRSRHVIPGMWFAGMSFAGIVVVESILFGVYFGKNPKEVNSR